MWYMYTMEYYSAIKKNTFESVLMRWMSLESIIQNEVSQKEKDRYHILTQHIWNLEKMILKNLFTGQQLRGIDEGITSRYISFVNSPSGSRKS